MLPADLTPERFNKYPPLARQLAISHLEQMRRLPLSFLPLLLREVIAYDWRFPAERAELDQQFAYLSAMPEAKLRETMAPFAALRLSAALEQLDWINSPAQFSEQLTAHLWATHQIDAFRKASTDYVHALNAAAPAPTIPVHRFTVVMVGAGVAENEYPLFRKLRPHGVYFTNVNAEGGREALVAALTARAKRNPAPFAHWYVDGSRAELKDPAVTCVSYDSLTEIRSALIDKMRRVMQPGGGGPELLRTMLAQMRPEDLGLAGAGDAGVLNHFQVSVLTEGSGTQLFSTTFVQWSAREVLRRAQPLTLAARFTPRQHEQSMRDLLAGSQKAPLPDAKGSLVDADMGAYYTWINQQRLAGADKATFLAWFEGHKEALAIGPGFHGGTTDASAIDLSAIAARLA